jgi:hypothetical protein
MERMILVMGASADQERRVRTFLDSQQTKGSPDYHHWLTPEQFGQKFGPAPEDIQQVTSWLRQQGFHINAVAKSGRWIEFSGNAAQVTTAFQTEMHRYLVNGRLHVANSTNISIPAALRPVVRGVLSLHDFHSQPMIKRLPQKVTGTLIQGQPSITFGSGSHAVAPGDFASIYDLNPLYNATPTAINGAGQTIAIVAVSNINISDVTNFRNIFGLPANPPTIIVNGTDPGVVDGADEATVDSEWAGAVAPNATIDLVVTAENVFGDGASLSASYIVDNNLAQIMSVSFGECESDLSSSSGNEFWQSLWAQAAAEGISVFVSAGDQGAAGCAPNAPSSTPAQPPAGVNGLASTPFNTAVGGTEFNENVNSSVSAATFWSPTNGPNGVSALGYIPERVWNDSCTPTTPNSLCSGTDDFLVISGGGGISTFNFVPSWQTLPIAGLTGAGFTTRVLPDVSLNAALHDPYVVCFSTPGTPDCQSSGGTITFNNLAGGTSISSPAFAGIMALINQKVKIDHPAATVADGRQGLASFVLYSLGAAESASALGFPGCNSSNQIVPTQRTSCAFNDITAGNNTVPNVTGFNASLGFDLASGLGSVDVLNLAVEWSDTAANILQGSATTLNAGSTPISITHGQGVDFTATVAKVSNTTSQTPTGSVELIAQGGNLAGSVPLIRLLLSGSGGTASTPTTLINNLPGGTNYTVSAFFAGDGTFSGSNSNALTVSVSREDSITNLTAGIINVITKQSVPGSIIAYGDPVNIFVIQGLAEGVSGPDGFPTGQITYKDGGTAFATIPFVGPVAALNNCLSTACLAPGTHSITGSYSGDLSFNPSTSGATTLTVTAGQPTLSLTAPATAFAGVPFTVSAALATGLGTIPATGSIQFFDGANPLGSAVVVSKNQVSTQVTLTASGAHNITAQYASNEPGTYLNANSSASVVTVSVPFNFTATSTSQTIVAGGTATYSLTLTAGGGFTGQVAFSCTGAPGGSSCTVSPNPTNLTSTTTSIPVTVTVTNTANALLKPASFSAWPLVLTGCLVGLLWRSKKKHSRMVLLALAVVAVLGLTSCGGGGGSNPNPTPTPTPTPKPNTNAVLTLTGTSGSATNNITLNLTITH